MSRDNRADRDRVTDGEAKDPEYTETYEDLLRSRDRLALILGQVADGITVQDKHGLIYANDAAARLSGLSSAVELIATPPSDLLSHYRIIDENGKPVSPGDLPGRRLLLGLDAPQRRIGFENMDTGDARWFVMRSTPLRDPEGCVLLAINVFHDITDQKRAEDARAEVDRRMHSIFESVLDALLTIDERGTIDSCNPATEKLFGYKAAEMIGRNVKMLMPEPYRSEHDGYLSRYLETGEPHIIGIGREVVGRRKDGTTFPMDLAVTELRQGSGRIFIGTLRNISERKELEKTLRQRADELSEAGARKDTFLAMLAHELRNPMVPILNAIELLRSKSGDDGITHRTWDIVDRQVRHMARLTDDLMDVSRITRGMILLCIQNLNLCDLVMRTVEDHRAQLESVGLMVSLEMPSDPVWVEGDPTRLSQVLGNLLQNASKFCERGGQVRVRMWTDSAAGRVALSVSDTGIGIEPEMLPHVFETFTQADRSLARSRGGMGLGLALVKGLVELHGGSVEAVSEGVGKGAEIRIQMPMAPGSGQASAPAAGRQAAPSRARVLVVDDNRDATETLAEVLRLAGHEVEVCYSGAEGLDTAAAWPPDVILCDIGLPGMDGHAVARAVRRNPASAGARLIAMSGYGQDEDRARSIEAGFDAHLTKPISPADILAAIAGRS